MNLRTALLLLLCGFFYKAAQYSSADLLSLATDAKSGAGAYTRSHFRST
jgi:hypothetical protein